jgi:hypothetical protein
MAGLSTSQTTLDSKESKPETQTESAPLQCEHCGSESLTLIKEISKPSWKTIFRRDSVHGPQWYRDWQRASDREFWDGVKGEGFSDFYEWHPKTEAQSARESAKSVARPPQQQLWFAGLESTGIYDEHSF